MLRPLFEDYWILKSQNPELYRQMKNVINHRSRGNADTRHFLVEELGYEYRFTRKSVKIVKRPHKVFPWMGIKDLKSKDDYVFFMIILAFLNEYREKYFTFMDIKEYIDANCQDSLVYDWKDINNRRGFKRALDVCIKFGLMIFMDGNVKVDFIYNDQGFTTHVALYENQFLASEFMPEYNEKLFELSTHEDFLETPLEPYSGIYRETDHIRRAINRDLALTTGFYEIEEEACFEYFMRYRSASDKIMRNLSTYLERNIDCVEGAILSTTPFDEARRGGFNNTDQISRIILSLNGRLRILGLGEEVSFYRGVYVITKAHLLKILLEIKEDEGEIWTKSVLEMDDNTLFDVVIDAMMQWRLILTDGDFIRVLPSVSKMIGQVILESELVEDVVTKSSDQKEVKLDSEVIKKRPKMEQLTFGIPE